MKSAADPTPPLVAAIAARLQHDGLGRSAVARALADLQAADRGPEHAAAQRLAERLQLLDDPRAAFERLSARLRHATAGATRVPDDAAERADGRADLLALVELAATPDFDIDLLRPWQALFDPMLAPPRSLREEAAAVLLLLATGADEAARAAGVGRALALLKAAPRGLDWCLAALALLVNATFSRDLALAQWLLRQPGAADADRLLDTLRALRWFEAVADWHFVERRSDDSIAAHEAAARRAEADGLRDRARAFRIGIAMARLGDGQTEAARAAIAAYSPLPADAPASQAVYAEGNLGWLARHERRLADSEAHCRRAAELARYAGLPALEQGVVLLHHARALVALQRPIDALAVMDEAAPLMQGRWVARLSADRLLVQALVELDAGRRPAAEALVRRGLDEHAVQSPPVLLDQTDEAAARVVALGLSLGLHRETLLALVRERGLRPPAEADASWPWALRIRLFDGPRVEGLVPGPTDARQKGESKPMQILQYLAAHAPAAVPAQRLADALWPDAEGDKAMRSLDVALTRLRPLLPDATLVQRNEGRIGLDPARVWCDAAAALELCRQLRSAAADDAEQARCALALLDLCRGALLPDAREPYARERAAAVAGQVAAALQVGLRAACRLADGTAAEEIVRRAIAAQLPLEPLRAVVAERAAGRAGTLSALLSL
ncbi:MAG: winged helix-turn-helix domain-containing protein [Rubrivivax sp.]